ncbi:MAG: FAD-dependent oxidoreductase [Anaerolineae bacterium]|jgi:hypothetical protein|nr:FAD-dependent oxidoreductase [Anaerolineae bacterium]
MNPDTQNLCCDVAVIGGSLGGVSAALAAAQAGMQVILTEETPWIGGQVTSQGVAPLDENRLIEVCPPSESYQTFRENIRKFYQETYGAPQTMPDGKPLNPGNGWVSNLCFEPPVGLQVLEEMLQPYVDAGNLVIYRNTAPIAAEGSPAHITSVICRNDRQKIEISADYFLDATDTGELLPLCGLPYTTGAEAQSETGEAAASKDGAHPERIQSFTYCFFVEFCPGEDHTIQKPEGYQAFRDQQPYSLTLYNREGGAIHYNMFEATEDRPLPFWTYRRVFDAALIPCEEKPNDIALINWHGNDYHWASPIDQPKEEQERILEEARRLALGFLYWLQTEVKRDDGSGFGYPELKLRKDQVGNDTGLSLTPYWREGRRIHGLYRIVAEDILREANPGKDQASFPDSVGIGWYAMDLHPAVGDDTSMYAPTLPFQIPLGAMIPRDCDNYIAANKNINTTHLSNGAYRLQPVEWAIGEAAGTLAAYCLNNQSTPAQVHEDPLAFHGLQETLHERGVKTEYPQHILDLMNA